MKALRLFFIPILFVNCVAGAQTPQWKSMIQQMADNLAGQTYQQYNFTIQSRLPGGDSSLIAGRYYINRRDSLFLSQATGTYIVVTRSVYLQMDSAAKKLYVADLRKMKPASRQVYMNQFFGFAEATVDQLLVAAQQLIRYDSTEGLRTIAAEITDHSSFSGRLCVKLDSETLPLELSYEIERFAGDPSQPETQKIKQQTRSSGYSYARNTDTEHYIRTLAKAWSSGRMDKNIQIIYL